MPLTLTPVVDDAPWTDIADARRGTIARVGGIPNGTAAGNWAVAIAIQCDDGTWVVGQTTMALMRAAVRGIA